jgi:hypothetical protein
MCLLYDATKAVKGGSTLPVKLQLCDNVGHNVSSSSITLHVHGIAQISSSASGDIQDPGSANPDSNFRFEPTLGTTGGYILNLSTKGLATGAYVLYFIATGDPVIHAAPFKVR